MGVPSLPYPHAFVAPGLCSKFPWLLVVLAPLEQLFEDIACYHFFQTLLPLDAGAGILIKGSQIVPVFVGKQFFFPRRSHLVISLLCPL